MGFFGRIKENRAHPSAATRMMLKAFGLGGMDTAAGVMVSEEMAMTLSAVYGCVKILAESRASLPLMVYERFGNGSKKLAINHPLYPILHDRPNPEMSSFSLREMGQAYLCLWGNEYCEIVKNRGGDIAEIWPLRADKMRVERKDGALRYLYQRNTGIEVEIPRDRVLHIPDLTLDGVTGISRISQARESIGLGMAAEQFGARFFKNGATSSGIAEYEGTLDDNSFDRFKQSFKENYQGLQNAHGVMFLEQGAKFHPLTIPPEDAQYLETRRFQVAEIARLFRVPLHLLQETEKSTSWGSGIEQMTLGFVVYTLRPWLVRVEQAYNNVLLSPEERKRYFIEHKIDGLLRGDLQTRYNAYVQGRQNGWLSANDIRRLESMNSIGKAGDVYLVNGNMLPADQAGQNQIAARLLRAAAERVARKEDSAISRGIDRPEEWFTGEHLRWAADVLAVEPGVIAPAMKSLAEGMAAGQEFDIKNRALYLAEIVRQSQCTM